MSVAMRNNRQIFQPAPTDVLAHPIPNINNPFEAAFGGSVQASNSDFVVLRKGFILITDKMKLQRDADLAVVNPQALLKDGTRDVDSWFAFRNDPVNSEAIKQFVDVVYDVGQQTPGTSVSYASTVEALVGNSFKILMVSYMTYTNNHGQLQDIMIGFENLDATNFRNFGNLLYYGFPLTDMNNVTFSTVYNEVNHIYITCIVNNPEILPHSLYDQVVGNFLNNLSMSKRVILDEFKLCMRTITQSTTSMMALGGFIYGAQLVTDLSNAQVVQPSNSSDLLREILANAGKMIMNAFDAVFNGGRNG
jgi:galactose-1-phosphate uridylyltransferase